MNGSIGELGDREIESLLRQEVVARIGYVDEHGDPQIAPIAYAYDGAAVLCYSPDGAKLDAMRRRPNVCVEVDRVHDVAEWISVIARGRFEELRGEAALDAVRRIAERLMTVASADGLPSAARRTYVARLGAPGVAYRIALDRKRGRFARVT
jgi:nitroimidazol reductase NimA-like FMN-containing flavoprotein (pyridoxamine 5'-phosphate oxidase superfamily)